MILKILAIANLFLIQTSSKAESNCVNKTTFKDSSLQERFIVSLLTEYKQSGRWIFIDIDSCSTTRTKQIINPMCIYKAYSESYTSMTEEIFIHKASVSILEYGVFSNCSAQDLLYGSVRKYRIEGIKINMEKYAA